MDDIFSLLMYALIIIIGVASSILDYQKKRKNKKKTESPAPEPKPGKREKFEKVRSFPKDGETVEILKTPPPPKPAVKKTPPTPAAKPKYDNTLACIIEQRRAETTRKTAKTDSTAPEPAKQENTLTLQARAGMVWSEILQPPVSMR